MLEITEMRKEYSIGILLNGTEVLMSSLRKNGNTYWKKMS